MEFGETHIFLTGRKGVGKSTLLGKVLRGLNVPAGGFLTKKVRLPGAERASVHLLHPGTAETPGEANFLFYCGDKGKETADQFDRMAVQALRERNGKSLIVMDELGPHEARALLFQQEVLRVLDGDIPVFGVLQDAEAPFLKEIAEHPRVQVIRVTEENRDSLTKELVSRLSAEIK